jgi:DNA-binding YbaB/EbfC family protein
MGGLLGGLQQRMADMKEKAATTKVEGVAGGGLVTVRLTCDYHVDSVSISPDAMDDREMLEDLVRAALAEALRQAREETGKGMKAMAGGLPIPPGLIPGL